MNPPGVSVVSGHPRLRCPCGAGFLGQLPVESTIDHHARTLTVSWFCKSCNCRTTAVFALGDGIWTHERGFTGREEPL